MVLSFWFCSWFRSWQESSDVVHTPYNINAFEYKKWIVSSRKLIKNILSNETKLLWFYFICTAFMLFCLFYQKYYLYLIYLYNVSLCYCIPKAKLIPCSNVEYLFFKEFCLHFIQWPIFHSYRLFFLPTCKYFDFIAHYKCLPVPVQYARYVALLIITTLIN